MLTGYDPNSIVALTIGGEADGSDGGTVDSADLQLVAQYLIGTITIFPV